MNKDDFNAMNESDEILNGFIAAILFYKMDAVLDGDLGLNHGCGRELKEYFHFVAESWLKNYFDNFSNLDYETFIREVKTRGNLKQVPRATNERVSVRSCKPRVKTT